MASSGSDPKGPRARKQDGRCDQPAAGAVACAVRTAAVRPRAARALQARVRTRHARAPRGVGSHRDAASGADVRQHDGGVRRCRALVVAGGGAVPQPGRVGHQRRAAGGAARDGGAVGGPLEWRVHGRGVVRARRRLACAARCAAPQRREEPSARTRAPRFRARRGAAARQRSPALCAGDAAPGRTDDHLRAKRAARRGGVCTGVAQRGRPGGAAHLPACRRAPSRSGARAGRRPRHHAGALADRAVSHLLAAA